MERTRHIIMQHLHLIGAAFVLIASTLLVAQTASAQTGVIEGTKWNDIDGNGVMDPGEPGVPGVTICLGGAEGGFPDGEGEFGQDCVVTDASGHYALMGLAAGEHTVYEILPVGATNTTPLSATVTLADGETVGDVNFGNKVAMPPPPEVTVEGASQYSWSNLPVVHFNNPTTFRKDVSNHCGANSPVAVKIVVGPFSDSGNTQEMMMTNVGGEIWEAAFPAFAPDHGTAALTFYVDCPPDTAGFPEDVSLISSEDEIQDGGNIYVDPSGRITDACTGSPLAGATVTLLMEDPPGSGFFIPAPPATPPLIPAVNPQITAADGSYGWVVIPGNYVVNVDRLDYSSAQSVVLAIPPAVTDLDFALTPLAGCPSPDVLLDSLIANTQALIDAGTFKNHGRGRSFMAKLESARKSLAKGNLTPTANKLRAFVSHVETFIKTGKLTAAEGQPLIVQANAIISLL